MSNSASVRQQGKAKALFAIKLLVTVLLFAVIVWKADWVSVADGFRHTKLFLIFIVFVSLVLGVTISTYKWQLLLSIHGAPFPFNRLHKYYFIAMFFNNFLPTSIGGDGYRIYKTLNNRRSKTSAVIAVFMERVTGLIVLLVIGFFGGAIGFLANGHELSRIVVIAGLVGAVAAIPILALAFNKRFMDWLTAWKRFPAILRNVIEHLGDYRRRSGKMLSVVIISFGFHIFTLFWWLLLIQAVGESLSFVDLAVVIALLSIVAVVPLSINGIGLVDGSFIYLAGQFGIGYEAALMVMLLQRVLLIPISLVGVFLYFAEKRAEKRVAPEGGTESSMEVES